MQFRTAHSLERCRQILYNHGSEILLLFGTQVDLNDVDASTCFFTVERLIRGRFGNLYTTSQITGTLHALDEKQTEVSLHVEIASHMYLSIVFLVLAVIFGIAARNGAAWLMVLVLVAHLGYEAFVIRKIINSLKG